MKDAATPGNLTVDLRSREPSLVAVAASYLSVASLPSTSVLPEPRRSQVSQEVAGIDGIEKHEKAVPMEAGCMLDLLAAGPEMPSGQRRSLQHCRSCSWNALLSPGLCAHVRTITSGNSC